VDRPQEDRDSRRGLWGSVRSFGDLHGDGEHSWPLQSGGYRSGLAYVRVVSDNNGRAATGGLSPALAGRSFWRIGCEPMDARNPSYARVRQPARRYWECSKGMPLSPADLRRQREDD